MSPPEQPTPVAEAMETLRDAAREWKVTEAGSGSGEIVVSFLLPLAAIERNVAP